MRFREEDNLIKPHETRYQCTEHQMEDKDIGRYISYGIRVIGEEWEVPDISTDRTFVDSLVQLLNREDVSPVHLYDIIEDLLGDLALL